MILKCPHCKEWFEMLELNCAIFRHGVYKSNWQQVDPHAIDIPDDIYGCGMQFQIINGEPKEM